MIIFSVAGAKKTISVQTAKMIDMPLCVLFKFQLDQLESRSIWCGLLFIIAAIVAVFVVIVVIAIGKVVVVR